MCAPPPPQDKNVPDAWHKSTDDILTFPPEDEINTQPLEIIQKFFSMENLASMFASKS